MLPCLLGCLHHAGQITEVYLNYEVTSEALFYPGDVIVAPMVTICVNNNHKYSCNDECFRNSSLYFASMRTFENTVQMWGRWEPGDKFGVYNMSTKDFARRYVTTFRVHNMACYAIDITHGFEKNYTFMDARLNEQSVITQMYVHAVACNKSNNCRVFVTRFGNLNLKVQIGMPLDNGYFVALHYQKQELNLLPPPYTTKCFDYEQYGIHSQEECIASFERVLYKNSNFSELPSFVPVKSDENVLIADESGFASNWSRKQCERTPCRLEQFTVYETVKRIKKNIALISLMFPENGELVVNYKPQTGFWEFLTLFGSVFGLWLGLDVMSTSNLMTKTANNIVRTIKNYNAG